MFSCLFAIFYYYWIIALLIFIYSFTISILHVNFELGRAYIWLLAKASKWIAFNNQKPLRRVPSLIKTNINPLSVAGSVPYLLGKEVSQFRLADAMDFCRSGIEAVVQDDVVPRFNAQELPAWNLLTRNSMPYYDDLCLKTRIFWIMGVIIRYFVLLPYRLALFLIGIIFLCISFSLLYLIPASKFHDTASKYAHFVIFNLFSCALSAVVTFHDRHNRPKEGVCVANHTSPLDVVFLSVDCCYLLTAQIQRGAFGMFQSLLLMGADHIWFDRFLPADKNVVIERLKQHISRPDSWPILMFPEGTCINNTSVMMFRKGGFEVGGVVYPVAIKYCHMFADAFWNSSRETFLQHICRLFTSWAIVADIWYLPPCTKHKEESTAEFANRLKQMIALHAQLEDMEWDGQLKRKCAPSVLTDKVKGYYSEYLKVECDL